MKGRSVKRNAKNARGLGGRLIFACPHYTYLRAWHRLLDFTPYGISKSRGPVCGGGGRGNINKRQKASPKGKSGVAKDAKRLLSVFRVIKYTLDVVVKY